MINHLLDVYQGKTTFKKRRSKHWRYVRREYLIDNPLCVCCGGNKKLQVHHIIPFHVAPELELDRANLITLCVRKKYGINCHLLVGHFGNFKKYSNDPFFDATTWYYNIHLSKHQPLTQRNINNLHMVQVLQYYL